VSEISQPQKDKYCMILLDKVPGVIRFIEKESRVVVARDWEEEEMKSYFLVGRVLALENEKFCGWMVVMV
jgi:predicted RNA-binding protein